MNKTIRYIMYVLIMIICIVSVFVGVYAVELRIAKDERERLEQSAERNEPVRKGEKSTTEKFKDLFTNEFFGSNFDDTGIKKVETNKPLVYSWSENINKDGKYAIDVHLPAINVDSEIVQKYNEATSQNFISKVNSLKSEEQPNSQFTIYETSFTSYINEDILSIAIRASLKEGNNAQRVIIKTYNYNLKTGQEVKISDILAKRGIEASTVDQKINEEVKEAAEEAESVAKTGYEIYKRNLGNQMYLVKNVTNFIQGPEGELYIIFDYGETNNTSEMDVIKI